MTRTIADSLLTRLPQAVPVAIQRTHVYSRSAARPVPYFDLPRRVEIRFVEHERIRDLDHLERDARLQRGDDCFAAWVDGELAHSCWIQTRGAHFLAAAGRSIPIPAGSFWIYDDRTAQAHADMDLRPLVLSRVLPRYFARGFQRAWGYSAEKTCASHQDFARLGFQRVAELRAIRLGRRVRPLGASDALCEPAERAPTNPLV